MLALAGRTALVSGSGGAIGAATAALLRAAGARVLGVDLPGHEPPAGVEALPCDLGDAAALAALGPALAARDAEVDLLVHCAGITRDAVLWKMDPREWDQVLRVNLESAFHLLRLVVPAMRRLRRGSVVLVASINGERGKFGQANYAASKAGLIALAKSAARELGGFGVRVNALAPGWIDTPMTARLPEEVRKVALAESALGRLGRPEDVARAILFLCSDLSSHVTGQVLRVDGGQCTA
ncbi:MAG: SDR family oxidoreductase [Planctomycetes bacterium]|nr:SDR family oxidoreductase [Planctomycetota bacterium]